jgi:hypothetical protein
MNWNPYFVQYARAHGHSPEEQFKMDQSRYPGGMGAGFLCWISDQKAAFKTAHPEAFIGHAICDHKAWGLWLEQAGNNPL